MKTLQILLISLVLTACASTKNQESSGEYVDNTAISLKVKARLLANKETKGTSIDVESYKGTVILSGFIDSDDERNKAINIAKSVQGVKEVKSALYIKSESL